MKPVRISSRERSRDAAEAWLAKNDPQYADTRKRWQTPSTDALASFHSERNIAHPSLEDHRRMDLLDGDPQRVLIGGDKYTLGVTGEGNYRRRRHDLESDQDQHLEDLTADDDA